VLRALWTREVVTFEGRWHKITDAGLNPLPVQRPIPIWIGGGISVAGHSPEEWVDQAVAWRDAGATHLSLSTSRAGLSSPDGHIEAMRRFKETIDGAGIIGS
jgi:hypothetical protein